jgi:hypothetical protein
VVTGLVAAAMFASGPTWAVDDLGLFELDEDATSGNAMAPFGPADDWEDLNPTVTGGSANQSVFIPDTSNTNSDDVLTGGQTKDDNDLDQWHWKHAKATPAKDDITNAYAAAYQSNGDLIVYFGADRFANNGDAQIGFWFLQNPVIPVDPVGNQNGTFSGVHAVGDILILANFLQGGVVGQVQVWEWTNGAGTDGNNNLALLGNYGPCDGSGADACALSNETETPAFWSYDPKFGVNGTFPLNSFFEGGINISAFFSAQGEVTPCFTGFMAESRASQSTDATLKDFAYGNFEVCETSALKVCNQDTDDAVFVPATGEVQYQVAGLITNTGLGSATVNTVTDSPIFDLGSLVLFELTGTPPMSPSYDQIIALEGSGIDLPYNLNPTEQIGWKATITGSNGTSDTVTVASEATIGGTDLLDATADATCPVKKVDGGISVTKVCSATLVPIDPGVDDRLMIQVEISGTVTNEGEIDLENVIVVDDTYGGLGNLFGPETLAKGATESWGPVTINPTSDREPPTALQCRFTDDVTATGEADPNFTNQSETCVLDDDVIVCTATADATCALCGIAVP